MSPTPIVTPEHIAEYKYNLKTIEGLIAETNKLIRAGVAGVDEHLVTLRDEKAKIEKFLAIYGTGTK